MSLNLLPGKTPGKASYDAWKKTLKKDKAKLKSLTATQAALTNSMAGQTASIQTANSPATMAAVVGLALVVGTVAVLAIKRGTK